MATQISERIPTIGPGTVAILRSRGILTNIDILFNSFPAHSRTAEELDDVPGIGSTRADVLRKWAQSIRFTAEERATMQEYESSVRQRKIDEQEERDRAATRASADRVQSLKTDRERFLAEWGWELEERARTIRAEIAALEVLAVSSVASGPAPREAASVTQWLRTLQGWWARLSEAYPPSTTSVSLEVAKLRQRLVSIEEELRTHKATAIAELGDYKPRRPGR